MGPAVFKGEVRPRVKGYIDLGIKGGATLLAGGKLHSNKVRPQMQITKWGLAVTRMARWRREDAKANCSRPQMR